ncbi:hypothetical protein Cni_G00935 [Canna indica]|uniref:Uncharacterized protein n=1 Tax=Canna indica TaxID=4628 RepID=A0AAQ3Q0E5_9LILI|nr:hypothetical protein Cni_G00935 [Canna indica]
MEKTDFREEKRKRFHEALLTLYYPPSPPRSPPPRSPQLDKDELLAMVLVCPDMELNLDQGDEHNDGSGSSLAPIDNVDTTSLTRAQRKRLRKRKLKEAASERRKLIGPLLPSSDQDLDEPSKASVQENFCEPGQDTAEPLSC